MKTWEQRRQRRPLGSVFGGQAPQKTEPSGVSLMHLAHYVGSIGDKGLSDGQQVYMPNMAKNMAKNCRKNAQNRPVIIKTAQILANGIDFLTFQPEQVILRRCDLW